MRIVSGGCKNFNFFNHVFPGQFYKVEEEQDYGYELFTVDTKILISSIYDFLSKLKIIRRDEEEDDLKVVVIHHSLIDLLDLVLREILEPEPLFDARTDWAKMGPGEQVAGM